MRVVRVHNDPFDSYGYVFFDCTPLQAAKYCEKNLRGLPKHISKWLREHSDDPPRGVTIGDVGTSANWIVWLQESPSTTRGMEVLAHEASHAAQKVMRHWSFEIVEETGELHAVLVGFIVRKVLQAIKIS